MSKSLPQSDGPQRPEDGRWIYLLPHATGAGRPLVRLNDILGVMRSSWYWMALVALVFTAAGIAYLHATKPWYRVEMVLAPTQRQSLPAGLGQLGGLANLAGISLQSDDSAELLALLQSRELAREFIE